MTIQAVCGQQDLGPCPGVCPSQVTTSSQDETWVPVTILIPLPLSQWPRSSEGKHTPNMSLIGATEEPAAMGML